MSARSITYTGIIIGGIIGAAIGFELQSIPLWTIAGIVLGRGIAAVVNSMRKRKSAG
jgi:hypothetical protein